MKNNYVFIIILIVAIGFLLLGMFHLFSGNVLAENYHTPEYIAAFFSISGVLFFCAALLYQIAEYKLQVKELRKSVIAQTKASEAMEEQRKLMQEQNANTLIFNMIESFSRFKSATEHKDSVIGFYKSYALALASDLKPLISKASQEDISKTIALVIKNRLITIKQDNEFHKLRRFVQFTYNTLYFLEQMKSPERKDWFTPLVYSMLSREELILIHLMNLVDFGVPFYANLEWHYQTTTELIEMINLPELFVRSNATIELVNELNLLRQRV